MLPDHHRVVYQNSDILNRMRRAAGSARDEDSATRPSSVLSGARQLRRARRGRRERVGLDDVHVRDKLNGEWRSAIEDGE